MKAVCYKSIHEINPGLWDSIVPENEPFHTFKFISVNEDAGVENSKFSYFLFYDEDVLVASAILSAFKISLDLFIGNNSMIRFIKKISPDFFKIKILVCGLPVSLGQRNIVVVSDKYTRDVLSILSGEMNKICDDEKIRHQAIKEFKDGDPGDFDYACELGFFKAHSIPYMKMKIQWNTFEEYLSALKHTFKRQVRSSLRKIGKTVPGINMVPVDTLPDENTHISIIAPAMCPPELFYTLYMNVMDRATTKLETLNEIFFILYYKYLEAELKLIAVVHKNNIISAAILWGRDDELFFVLIGKEKEKDLYDSYFNLVYGIIDYAITNKYKLLNLGQTSYWVKQRIGGYPEKEYIYFKSENRFVHFLLKSLKKLIFPDLKLPAIHTFKLNK